MESDASSITTKEVGLTATIFLPTAGKGGVEVLPQKN